VNQLYSILTLYLIKHVLYSNNNFVCHIVTERLQQERNRHKDDMRDSEQIKQKEVISLVLFIKFLDTGIAFFSALSNQRKHSFCKITS